MLLDEVMLERYGAFERRSLTLSPGLNVVHGPNEAGKSTCLHAIRDFLFRIPERSPRCERFGSDAARIGVRLTTANGARLSLKRRFSRGGRTLFDDAGTACDDAALSGLLGAVDRDRFETLFGLDHEDLRRGGEALLAARGDVGKLIVEAGGGLRALVARLDGLDRRIDGLFAPRRKEGRAFYDALTAYGEADKAAKAGSVTRDAHERDRRAAEAASAATERLRVERRELGERASRLGRLGRTIPILRRLDAATEALAAFEDVAHLPEDVPARCTELLDGLEATAARREEALGRLVDVRGRRDGMRVDARLVAAEAEIRDVEASVAVVRAARGDRAAREAEAGQADAQLGLLRERLGLGPGVDLPALLPPPPALRAVVDLAEREAGDALRLRTTRKAAAAAADVLAETEARLASMAARGHDEAFGVDAASFATLPSEWATAASRSVTADGIQAEADGRASELGLPDAAAARRLACPDEEQVRTGIATADALRVERARLGSTLAHALAEREAARVDAAALLEEGEVASVELIGAARRERDEAWEEVRTSYVGGAPRTDEAGRRATAMRLDAGIAEADRLADKRGAEADRVAALAQARRRAAVAEGAIDAAERAVLRIDEDLAGLERTFEEAFPDAYALRPGLASLLPFSMARRVVVEATDRAVAERRAGDVSLRTLEPAMARLGRAELRAGIVAGAATNLGARVQAVALAIGAHDRAHEAWSRERGALPGHQAACRAANSEVAEAERDVAEWGAAWAVAVGALGARTEEPVSSTAALARTWEQARGDLRVAAQARGVLARMDADEAGLGRRVASVAVRVGLVPTGDPVAAADALVRLRTDNEAARLGREALGPEVAEAEADLARCDAELDGLGARLAALAAAIGEPCDEGALRSLATRGCLLVELRRDRDSLVEAARVAGEGLGLRDMRREAEGRDLDVVRAEASEVAGRLETLDGSIEASIAEEVRSAAALRAHHDAAFEAGRPAAAREAAVADMQEAVERWVELKVARRLLQGAMTAVREERQDPLVVEAGRLFSRMTRGAYSGVATDVDERGSPVVRGVRVVDSEPQPATAMSEGTRDQMFLAFRLASISAYCAAAEPLPFVADDILVHFDDDRTAATLNLLAEFAAGTQVLLFTHHRAVRDAATRLLEEGRASLVDLAM